MTEQSRTGAPVINISELGVKYGGQDALRGVSLAVEPGEVYALLGRNGAGKTSLVRCLLGHQKAHRGRVLLFGEDAWSHRRQILTRVGVVPEEPDAPPQWTSSQIVRFFSRLYPGWDQGLADGRLEKFRIPLDRPFGRLSKGQKGQVMLTMALAGRPQLLVLDDPTLGLDVVARHLLFDELIGELADHGTTVLITTHDLAGVEGIADRVGVLHDQRLILDEALDSIKSRFRRIHAEPATNEQAPAVLEQLGLIGATRHTLGWEWVVDRFSEEALAGEQAMEEPELAVHPMSLEDIFITLTGESVEAKQ